MSDYQLETALEAIRQNAYRNATKTKTGVCYREPVAVRYYPVSRRYAWWVNGQRSTIRHAAYALKQSGRVS